MPGMISITGKIGQEPKVRETNGGKVASLRVGCRVGYGERACTLWWDVDVWGKPAEWASQMQKGEHVTVMGELTGREHEGKTYYGIRASSVTQHERQDARQSERKPEPMKHSNNGF